MLTTNKNMTAALLCGLFGCLCFGAGDWLMIYGDMSHAGAPSWLTAGAAAIPLWRFTLAMALAFPGIILYGVALFAMQHFVTDGRGKKTWHYLTAFGLTPWLALHLFYIMILVLFAWLNANGYAGDALTICGALFSSLSWIVPVSEALMLPPFVWWFVLQVSGRTVFPKWFALTNVLIIFALLKGVSLLLPVSAFRIAFTNGLMSESMIVWFVLNFCAGRSRLAQEE